MELHPEARGLPLRAVVDQGVVVRVPALLLVLDAPVASLGEDREPQPEPQRGPYLPGRWRTFADAIPLMTCTDRTGADFGGPLELDWGSRGRRFKSCQPDSVESQVRRRVRRGPERRLTAS